MDINKEFGVIEHKRRVFEKSIDFDSDFQEALPAYCDDIYRVVKCTSRSCITSADVSFNEIKIFGKTIICITYFNENSELCYADFEEVFNKTVSAEGLSDNAFVCADITDKYTSFRVINQRRIDIHISSVIQLSAYDGVKCSCLNACGGARLRNSENSVIEFIGCDISKAEFDEEFDIKSDSEPIKRIISYCADACVTESKIIKDKALVKCAVNLCVFYSTDSSDSPEMAQHTFNVSKIFQLSGIDDGDFLCAKAVIGSVFLKAKRGSDDSQKAIEAYGDIYITSLIARESRLGIIDDGYLINRKSECKYANYMLCDDYRIINENREVKLRFDLSGDVEKAVETSLNISRCSLKDSKLCVKVNLYALCLSKSGDCIFTNSAADFETEAGYYSDAAGAMSIESFEILSDSGDTLEVKADLRLSLILFNMNAHNVLSDMEITDENVDAPSLTVYFGKSDESLWDIAKRFSSDTEIIEQENGISAEKLNSDRILIIPSSQEVKYEQ